MQSFTPSGVNSSVPRTHLNQEKMTGSVFEESTRTSSSHYERERREQNVLGTEQVDVDGMEKGGGKISPASDAEAKTRNTAMHMT